MSYTLYRREHPLVHTTATISDCGMYRYALSRSWRCDQPKALFVMLNPSAADARKDDPTIRRCSGFAHKLGFGGFVVVNLFAFRATHPKDLFQAADPVGPDNNRYIEYAVRVADEVICGWGANAETRTGKLRAEVVLDIIRKAGKRPKALKLTARGIPSHPLRLPYSCTLVEVDEVADAKLWDAVGIAAAERVQPRMNEVAGGDVYTV